MCAVSPPPRVDRHGLPGGTVVIVGSLCRLRATIRIMQDPQIRVQGSATMSRSTSPRDRDDSLGRSAPRLHQGHSFGQAEHAFEASLAETHQVRSSVSRRARVRRCRHRARLNGVRFSRHGLSLSRGADSRRILVDLATTKGMDSVNPSPWLVQFPQARRRFSSTRWLSARQRPSLPCWLRDFGRLKRIA